MMGRPRGYVLLMALLVGTVILTLAQPGVAMLSNTEKHKRANHKAVVRSFNRWVDGVSKDYDQKQLEAYKKRSVVAVHSLVAGGSYKLKERNVITVNKHGMADFRTVQAAVDSIKAGNEERVVIQIGPGVYYEKILVPKTKPYITFQGAGARRTILSWGDTAGDFEVHGTSRSASTAVEADYFIAKEITFRNSAPAPTGGSKGRQAVAFRIKGDKAAFYTVSFYGAQDTLYDQAGRHYFENCFIQGSIDFIFGNGQSLYKNCHLNSISHPWTGALTAQKRTHKSKYTGYSFVNCYVTGTGPIYLGRAWGPYSRVVFIRTYFEDMIIPAGWFDWGLRSRRKTVFFGQYKCSGPGANLKSRVHWSRELTAKEAKAFSSLSYIDGKAWLSKY